MAKSIIVYGVPGGKTRFAQRIADHFGLEFIPYREGGSPWDCMGQIHFSDRAEPHHSTAEWARSFQSVADEINATISLTDWQSGPPPMVGEWNASGYRFENTRRWWNGKNWSMNYSQHSSEEHRNQMAKTDISPSDREREMEWRGLSAEPIKVTE